MFWSAIAIVGIAAAVSLGFAFRKRATVRRLFRQGLRARPLGRASVPVSGSHLWTMPHLAFPMVSLLPGTGRTMWLSMLHRQFQKGNLPRALDIVHLRDRPHEDFDGTAEAALSGLTSKSDWYVPPYSYEMLVIENDGLGQVSCSAVLQQHCWEDKRELTRAHRQEFGASSLTTCHGVFILLDPSRASIAERRSVMDRFNACVNAIDATRTKTRVPVAICVTKIDLLKLPSRQDAEGDGPIDSFYSDLAEIGWGHDLPSIRRRSELTRNLCESIWPEWEIETQTENAFGARPMFFPMTPVGLYGLGEDLANRVISPVGILHPLLWLLHINGYMTLPSRTEQ